MGSKKTKKLIIIAAIVVLVIGCFAVVKSLNKNENTEVSADNTVTEFDETNVAEVTDASDEVVADVIIDPETDEEITEATTVVNAVAHATKEEIIALYNEAANKVKVQAKKVTRNFKNTRFDTSKSVLPSALESMANPMIEKYVKDDVEPVDYVTKEDIIENYPAPKQTYSSKLTSSDVTEATCVDNGNEYVITLKLASCTNPTPGVKVGAACHIMDVSAIASSDSSMIKKFDAIYENCVITCKIDKATSRITWANFYTPFTIDAVVKILFSEVVTVAVMSYERDYTIIY